MTQRAVACVGIDVGSKSFHVAVHGRDNVGEFENTEEGRAKVVRYVRKVASSAVVVLESTGPYGLDLALQLHRTRRVEVRYVNPTAAKAYAKSGLVRAKTDRVDAHMLARMAADRRGQAWQPPSDHALALRALTRRIRVLTNDRTREKNRLGSTAAVQALPDVLLDDIREHITALDERIDRMRAIALEHARKDPQVAAAIELLATIPGIGVNTAVEVLGELRCMPRDLTARQLVAQAGLDPRAKQSGMRDGRRSISKMGSKYLRAALHMAAINGVRWCPEIAAFHTVLTEERHKPKLVAYVAVARKLLHTMHGMLRSETAFDASRFYNPRPRVAA